MQHPTSFLNGNTRPRRNVGSGTPPLPGAADKTPFVVGAPAGMNANGGYDDPSGKHKVGGKYGCDLPVFPYCEGYTCELPEIECNHATPSLQQWRTLEYFHFIAEVLCANVCYAFVLMYLLIEYAPQDSIMNLVLFAFVRAFNIFGINLWYTAFTGGYVNPVFTIGVWLGYLTTYRSDPNGPGPSAGWEFLKGFIAIIFQFAGYYLAIFFIWVLFGATNGYPGNDYGSPVMVGGVSEAFFRGNAGAPVALNTFQGAAREFVATFAVMTGILVAHSDPRTRRRSILAALIIACTYGLASALYGQTTNAIMNPLYWLAVRSINSSAGDGAGPTLQGFLVYFIGPLLGMLASVLMFVIRYYFLGWVCSRADAVCKVPNQAGYMA